MPVSLRAPDVARSTAQGRTGSGAWRAARSAAGTPAAKASSRASSYSSGASVAAHQTRRSPGLRRKWSQSPDQAGFRSPGTVFARPAIRPDTEPVDEPMNRTGCDGSQKRLRRSWRSFETGSAAVQAEVRHAFQPLADQREIKRRGRDGGLELHHEDARRLVPDLATPLDGAVGHEADLAEEGGGAAVVGHQVDSHARGGGRSIRLGGSRDGPWGVSSHHHAEPTAGARGRPSATPVARRAWTRPAAVAALVAGIALAAALVGGVVSGSLAGGPAAASPTAPLQPVAIATTGPSAGATGPSVSRRRHAIPRDAHDRRRPATPATTSIPSPATPGPGPTATASTPASPIRRPDAGHPGPRGTTRSPPARRCSRARGSLGSSAAIVWDDGRRWAGAAGSRRPVDRHAR